MNDWSNLDRGLLGAIEPVVAALSEIVSAEQILLVGAQCRDLLSWCFGCDAPRRSTNDTDFGLALEDWDQFDQVRENFPASGHTGHRFLIGGVPTDVVPFGTIEEPAGRSTQPSGKESLNVHGFTDVYQRADLLPPSGGIHVRIPRPEGYAILKIHAWLDRSARNEYKDGPDLALAVYWYANDLDRIYDEENVWALELHDFDIRRAAAALLGRDMRNGLSQNELVVLAARIDGADRDLLARNFGVGAGSWPSAHSELRLIVDSLFNQLVA